MVGQVTPDPLVHVPAVSEARLVPASASRHLGRLIPGARCHIVPDAGHNLALERPAEFLKVLLPFLREDVGRGEQRP